MTTRTLALAAGLFWIGATVSAEESTRRQRAAWAQQAADLATQKDFAGAAALYARALDGATSKTNLAAWWTALGRCQENLRNFQQALTAYQQAYSIQPKNVDKALDLARVYDKVDLPGPAAELYEKALQQDGDRQDILFALAAVQFRAGQTQSAKKNLALLIKAAPQDAGAQKLMARIEAAQGDLAAASRRWEGLLAQKPSPDEYVELARLWMRQGQWELARNAFDKAAAQGHASADFYVERGVASWYLNKPADAERDWEKALAAAPDSALPRFFLALSDRRDHRATALRRLGEVQTKAASPLLKDLAGRLINILGAPPAPAREKTNG